MIILALEHDTEVFFTEPDDDNLASVVCRMLMIEKQYQLIGRKRRVFLTVIN